MHTTKLQKKLSHSLGSGLVKSLRDRIFFFITAIAGTRDDK